jgi:hypothetical protein
LKSFTNVGEVNSFGDYIVFKKIIIPSLIKKKLLFKQEDTKKLLYDLKLPGKEYVI